MGRREGEGVTVDDKSVPVPPMTGNLGGDAMGATGNGLTGLPDTVTNVAGNLGGLPGAGGLPGSGELLVRSVPGAGLAAGNFAVSPLGLNDIGQTAGRVVTGGTPPGGTLPEGGTLPGGTLPGGLPGNLRRRGEPGLTTDGVPANGLPAAAGAVGTAEHLASEPLVGIESSPQT